MTPETLADMAAVAPELWLLGAIVLAVIADLVFGAKGRDLVGAIAIAGCGFALSALFDGATGGEDGRAFGMLSVDGFASFFRALIISGTGLVVLHGLVFRGMEDSSRNEFAPMLLGTALGGCLLVAADHLIMVLLSLEVLSLNSYLLAGWQRKERRSSEAALKYLIYGAVASALMTFGLSLFWGLAGTMNLAEVGQAVGSLFFADLGAEGALATQVTVVFATVLVFVGFLFKISAFPFHFWAPDVYEGAPTPVTALLAVSSKAAAFGLLVRFVDSVFVVNANDLEFTAKLGWVMTVLAAVTMTYGNVTAVLQRNVKRLLAYSSIAHAGYLLMGVAVMLTNHADADVLGRESLLFYLATYYLGTLGAFGCVMYLANRFGAEDLQDYEGLGWSAPFICGALVLFLVSLTGLPPTAGFAGKLMLFRAALATDLDWLAVVAALNAVVALFYYFKLARALFLRGDSTKVAGLPSHGAVPFIAMTSVFALLAATLWYGLAFDDLTTWVASAGF